MTDTRELLSAPALTGVADPYMVGQYEPVRDERDDPGLRVTGELPEGLAGVYMRNGGNPYFTPPGTYHVFDGDGMIHGVYLDGEGGASYSNRWVRSRGLEVELSRGHAVYGGLSEFRMPDQEALEAGGLYKNTANTNIIEHAGRYLALMEGAHPTEVGRDLSTIGEYDFEGRLQGPMTAHPRIDPRTGSMAMFGYSPFPPFLRYHEVDANGALTRTEEIPIDRSVMIHDFVITDEHVVFFDLPAIFDVEALLGGDAAIRWRPDEGARIGIMPRGGAGSDTVWIDVEPFYVFHFMNAWQDGPGRIVVDGCRASAMPTSFGDEPLPDADVRPHLWRWEIDLDECRVEDHQLSDRTGDFPRIDDRVTGSPHRYGTYGHTRSWGDSGVEFDGVVQFDRTTGDETVHVYGPHHLCGEAVFAADPASASENDGWLLNFVTDMAEGTTQLVVLDAHDISAGAVARVDMPRRVPFGFHGNWMPSNP